MLTMENSVNRAASERMQDRQERVDDVVRGYFGRHFIGVLRARPVGPGPECGVDEWFEVRSDVGTVYGYGHYSVTWEEGRVEWFRQLPAKDTRLRRFALKIAKKEALAILTGGAQQA